MADPENLNKFRKAKKRAEARQQAVENRIRHGRTAPEKERDRAEALRRDRLHRARHLVKVEDE